MTKNTNIYVYVAKQQNATIHKQQNRLNRHNIYGHKQKQYMTVWFGEIYRSILWSMFAKMFAKMWDDIAADDLIFKFVT